MSVGTEPERKETPLEPHHEAHQKAHPSDWTYIKVALILGAITAAEVATYWWKDATTAQLVALLFPMMVIKFGVVCAYFMHLRFDNPLFRRVFVFGLVLAVTAAPRGVAAGGGGRRVGVLRPAGRRPQGGGEGRARRHARPGRLARARRAAAVGGVRLAGPRHRRGVPFLGARVTAHTTHVGGPAGVPA